MEQINFPKVPNRADYVFVRFYRQEDAVSGPIQVSDEYDEREKWPLLLEAEKLVGVETTGEEQEGTAAEFVQKHGYDLAKQFDEESWKKAVEGVLAEKRGILKQFRDKLFAEFERVTKKKHCWQMALAYASRNRQRGTTRWDHYFPGITKTDKFVLHLDNASLSILDREFRSMISILTAPDDPEGE